MAKTGDILYRANVWLAAESNKHTRGMYNALDLLGDLGGVTEVIMIFFGFILTSVSEHSFYTTAT